MKIHITNKEAENNYLRGGRNVCGEFEPNVDYRTVKLRNQIDTIGWVRRLQKDGVSIDFIKITDTFDGDTETYTVAEFVETYYSDLVEMGERTLITWSKAMRLVSK